MKEPFTFYRAADPVKGSWDGYGYFPNGEKGFVAYVTDAPSGASIHTPEIILQFWTEYCRKTPEVGVMELADGINRLQDFMQQRGQADGATYQATISIVSQVDDVLYHCTIGDSILQVLRNDKLYRLSESEIWNSGLIFEPSEKPQKRQKTQALAFIGSGGEFISRERILEFSLHSADRIILSSDGMEDLLSPGNMIQLLQMGPATLRSEFEKVCAQQSLKDDVTVVVTSVDIPQRFSAEKAFGSLNSQLNQIRKEQEQFRNDLAHSVLPVQRLERMERSIQDLNKQIHSLQSRPHAPSFQPAKQVRLWYFVALAFVTGIAATLGVVTWNQPKAHISPSPAPQREIPDMPRTMAIEPPEIVPPQDCTYIIEKGDTIQKIADHHHISVAILQQMNPELSTTSAIQIGQKINICRENP